MSKSFDGTISDIHLVTPIPNGELGQLKQGFAIAVWISPKNIEVTIIRNDCTETANT